MQIDSNGHLGINVASTTQLANSKQLTLRPTDDDGIRFVRPGDGNNQSKCTSRSDDYHIRN